MGFMDKAKAAASTAKNAAVAAKGELDKSGLIDQLKAKDTSESPSEPERDTMADMLDSIRRGAIDPRTVISKGEVEAIAGHPVGAPSLSSNGDFVYVTFDGANERYGVHCVHNTDDDYPWDPAEQWQNLRDVFGDDGADVEGIGDDAFRQGDTVYFLVAGRVLFTEASGGKLSADAKAIRAEQLARTVAANVRTLA